MRKKTKSVKDMSLMELCELYCRISDEETKQEIQQYIAFQLATNQNQKRELLFAMREPLRYSKHLKKGKTRFSYIAR